MQVEGHPKRLQRHGVAMAHMAYHTEEGIVVEGVVDVGEADTGAAVDDMTTGGGAHKGVVDDVAVALYADCSRSGYCCDGRGFGYVDDGDYDDDDYCYYDNDYCYCYYNGSYCCCSIASGCYTSGQKAFRGLWVEEKHPEAVHKRTPRLPPREAVGRKKSTHCYCSIDTELLGEVPNRSYSLVQTQTPWRCQVQPDLDKE